MPSHTESSNSPNKAAGTHTPHPPGRREWLRSKRDRLRRHLPHTFIALRHRDFRLFWSARLITLVGNWMQRVAQGWLVLQLTDSPFLLGVVSFSGAIPVMLLGLFAGVTADRVDRRRLLLATQSSAMLLALTLAALTASGHIQVTHIIAIVVLMGVVNAYDGPARQAIVVDMVGKDDLMNAVALNSSAFNMARIIGPPLAGLLIARVGIAGCFLLNGLGFLPVIAALASLRLDTRPHAPRRTSPLSDLREGLAYIAHDRVIFTILSLFGASGLFAIPYITLLPVFARDVLDVGPEGLGLMTGAIGVGALTSGLLLASLQGYRSRGWLFTVGNLGLPLVLLVFAQLHWFPLALVALACAGFAMIMQNTTGNTLIQSLVPDELRGRVLSTWMWAGMGLTQLGGLQAGAIADRWGAPTAVTVGALACLAMGLWALWRRPEVRHTA